MIRIIADNKIPFLRGALDGVADVCYIHGSEIDNAVVRDADALIVRTRTRCDERLLQGSRVKYVATATIGFDHLDIEYLVSSGISWSNAPGCNSGSVMQYISSALAFITSVSGKRFGEMTLGIVGVGHVGKKIENMARTLGINVLLNDPPREREEGSGLFTGLDRLLRDSDIVTLHVPLNRTGEDKSFHLADVAFIGRMKRGAWLINTSRGEVMQTSALTAALREGHLEGSVIDVWENEPEIDRELLSLTGIGTPHIAGYSLDGKANGTAASVNALSRYFGLGMDDWYPDSIPPPSQGIVQVENRSQSLEELSHKIFKFTYDIAADSSRLKANPGNFEKFRDDYPPRREFGAYRLDFKDSASCCVESFIRLGFKI